MKPRAEKRAAEHSSDLLVSGTPIRSDSRSQFDSLERRPGMRPEIA